MNIVILGSGCTNCTTLEDNTRQAIAQLGCDATISHDRDLATIAGYGVMHTPAIVVNGQVMSSGRVLTVPQIVALLQSAQ